MKTFLFHIGESYMPTLKVFSPYYCVVRYDVVDNKVAITSVEIPYDLLHHINVNGNFAHDVYYAAENNAMSFDLIKQDAEADLFKEMGITNKPLFDMWKDLTTRFNPQNVKP